MTQQFLNEFIDGGPGCGRDDCIVEVTSGATTMHYVPPAINGNGLTFNSPKTTTHTNKRCAACGKSWTDESYNAKGQFL